MLFQEILSHPLHPVVLAPFLALANIFINSPTSFSKFVLATACCKMTTDLFDGLKCGILCAIMNRVREYFIFPIWSYVVDNLVHCTSSSILISLSIFFNASCIPKLIVLGHFCCVVPRSPVCHFRPFSDSIVPLLQFTFFRPRWRSIP